MTRLITMKEIAVAAGVSTATISRALGTHPRIPDATRQRIRKLAISLGYRPNPLLSAYARQRRGKTLGAEIATLAYVTNFPTADEWRGNTFYQLLFKGAVAQARRNGYKLEHFWLREPGMTGKRLSGILDSRGISGVCIAPTPVVRRIDLEWSRFCCVTIGYSLLQPLLHRTAPHHFQAVLIASRKLWRLGYTRIGLCIKAATSPQVNDLWLAGALVTQQQNPQTPLKVFLYEETSRGDIPAWIAKERLEVILSDNPQALRDLTRGGAQAADNVSFITLNWTRHEADVAGIDQRPGAIGAAAMDLLFGLLQRGERGIPKIPITSMIDGEWIGGSRVAAKSDLLHESP
ncbi:MAG: LacI family transcriptional regulator [Rariglobus sp.]|jgi:DNA-binding LacI/PurR family transcriptional regulator|nr:LacI family transcriptional regulator [Rariglobus sp.]